MTVLVRNVYAEPLRGGRRPAPHRRAMTRSWENSAQFGLQPGESATLTWQGEVAADCEGVLPLRLSREGRGPADTPGGLAARGATGSAV